MYVSKSVLQMLAASVLFTGFAGYSFMNAAWTAAPANPPLNNVDAPINTGASPTSIQSGQGALQFDFMSARDTIQSNVEVRSPNYCDLNGENCYNGLSNDFLQLYTYSTQANPQNFPEGSACSCRAGELLTGCSGFQQGDHDTERLSGNRNGCYSDGGNTANCHCMGVGSTAQEYSWSATTWSACSANQNVECGQKTYGTQTRSVSCVQFTGAVVPDNNCTGIKPAPVQACSYTGKMNNGCS